MQRAWKGAKHDVEKARKGQKIKKNIEEETLGSQ